MNFKGEIDWLKTWSLRIFSILLILFLAHLVDHIETKSIKIVMAAILTIGAATIPFYIWSIIFYKDD